MRILRQAAELHEDIAREGGNRGTDEVARQARGLQLGEIENVVDQSFQPVGVDAADVQELAALGWEGEVPRVGEDLERPFDRGQRRTELVGNDGHEVRLHPLELTDLIVNLSVVDRDRSLRGQPAEKLAIAVGERGLVGAEDRHRSADFAFPQKRHDEGRPVRAVRKPDRPFAGAPGRPNRLVQRIGEQGPGRALGFLLGGAARDATAIRTLVAREEQGSVPCAGQFEAAVEDEGERPFQVERGGDLLPDFIERADPARRFVHACAQLVAVTAKGLLAGGEIPVRLLQRDREATVFLAQTPPFACSISKRSNGLRR